jgi:predicted HTH transcriptional regulator
MKEFDELDISLRETKAHKLMQRADLRERVLRCIRQNPDMTMTEIQKRFGISHSLFKALLSEAKTSEGT